MRLCRHIHTHTYTHSHCSAPLLSAEDLQTEYFKDQGSCLPCSNRARFTALSVHRCSVWIKTLDQGQINFRLSFLYSCYFHFYLFIYLHFCIFVFFLGEGGVKHHKNHLFFSQWCYLNDKKIDKNASKRKE